MASKRLNVLVYSGNGSTIESVRHAIYTLRRLLSPTYAVLPVTGDAIIKEPWTSSCALLVFPGGADLGYCRTLNGAGNRRISQYVERGGNYLGLCAGGYYGSSRCEFEIGNGRMEVVGDRELGFYPGVCRGCAKKGFVYHSEVGAQAVEVEVDRSLLTFGSVPERVRVYCNGGGVFVDAEKCKSKGVEVLARFAGDVDVDHGDGKAAAVVYCKVGEGAAILTSPHPEFAAVNLDPNAKDAPDFPKVVEALKQDDALRVNFFKACLSKLGLQVSQEETVVPSLSRMYLSSSSPDRAQKILSSLEEIIVTEEDGEQYIKDENDTFHLEDPSTWSMSSLKTSLDPSEEPRTNNATNEDRILDYSTIQKRLVICTSSPPSPRETPYFNHAAYYSNLSYYQSLSPAIPTYFGNDLLYGEVVTSTNTILEKNTQTLRRLPTGLTFTATVQVAGRGRGLNPWISPSGSLMFSTCIQHPVSLMKKAPVVFLQYLTALSIVEGIAKYGDGGYENLDVRLKWPNDIYAKHPTTNQYTKIGGILVNSHYSSSTYHSVIGIGLNLSNTLPTTSLSALISSYVSSSSSSLAPITTESLLPSLLTSLSHLYHYFSSNGWDDKLEKMYYKYWLHTDQIVTLEMEAGTKARIKGISRDWGMLVVEELAGESERGTGRIVQLVSDGNSFDFFRGLVRRKV